MPTDAVWAALDGKAIQGKLDILSLRSLIGEINSRLVIYTEDNFASEWVLSMLRTEDNIATDAIEIYAMGGDGTAVNANRYHNQDPSHKVESICIIDGDSLQKESDDEGVFRLPGLAPELIIFNEIVDIIDECSGVLAVRCMRQFREDSLVSSIILDIKNTNYDHHILFSQIGEKLGFVNESVIRTAFLTTWCERYPDKVNEFISRIRKYLPCVR